MFKFLKRKQSKEGLEKAKEMKLISETEFLQLKSQRAEQEFKEHLTKKIKKKK